jgi:hypothetical protein
MKTIKLESVWSGPDNYTGIVENPYGDKVWFLNGLRHRVDGPACVWDDGDEWWYLTDEYMTEEEHSKRTAYLRTTLGRLILKEHFTLGDENASKD